MVPFTDEELITPVKNLIQKIKPSLALDGGDVIFLTIKDSTVYVQFRGACIDCDSNPNTLQYAIARRLKMDIHPDIEVISVPEGMENDINNL